MSLMGDHEAAVDQFYSSAPDGLAVTDAYVAMMGQHGWFHGARDVLQAGGSNREAAEAMLERLARHAQIGRGSRVLEFGSGVGAAAVSLAEAGAKVVGISNTDDHSRRARTLAASRGLRGRASFVTVGHEDYKTLDAWPDGAFDAVLFMESVCHLPAKELFFRSAHRVIRPGGRLVGLDWMQRPYGDHQSDEQISRLIDPVCDHFRLAQPLGTLESYTSLMSTAGFDVTHAEDEYAGQLCLGNTEPSEEWFAYQGRSTDLIAAGKVALDAARAAGVFTVGWWAATRR